MTRALLPRRLVAVGRGRLVPTAAPGQRPFNRPALPGKVFAQNRAHKPRQGSATLGGQPVQFILHIIGQNEHNSLFLSHADSIQQDSNICQLSYWYLTSSALDAILLA
jgi:hypothetical protein